MANGLTKKMKNLYRIQNLQHHYNGHPALDIDSLTIQTGTITGFIGPNGSGKSTLLKMLAFIEKPSQGSILFKDLPAEPFADHVRFQATLLTQEPYLMKRSVFKNISYGLELRKDLLDLQARVYDALALVGLHAETFAHRKWYELSGGEAQRVALAARLILKPEVLLLDEPTASIDAESDRIIRETTLMARSKWGTTLIIASHDWEWLYDICEHVIHLIQGRIYGSGRQNVIHGPWHQNGPDLWGKSLTDDQFFQVPLPPSDNAIAILNPENLHVTSEDGSATIKGIVTRMVLEQNSRNVITIVQAGNQTFTLTLTPPEIDMHALCPGQNIRFRYSPDDINWY